MKEFFSYASPFIAAFLASFLTYFFTVRAKKHEILVAQKLLAFKAIQSQLVKLRGYYQVLLSDKNEFISLSTELSELNDLTAAEKGQMLDLVLSDNEIFFSLETRNLFRELIMKLQILGSANLMINANQLSEADEQIETYENSLYELYEGILNKIEECTSAMYKDLKLPK